MIQNEEIQNPLYTMNTQPFTVEQGKQMTVGLYVDMAIQLFNWPPCYYHIQGSEWFPLSI